jgi:hypothetical protein
MTMPPVLSYEPVYVIGDSHCLAFRFLGLDLPHYFSRPLVTIPVFVPELSGRTIVAGDELNADVLAALIAVRAIVINDGRLQRFGLSARSPELRAANRYVLLAPHDHYNFDPEPTLLFTAGVLDASAIVRELGPETDFVIEDPAYDESAFDGPDVPVVPSAFVERLVAKQLAPYGAAFARLSAMGFDRVYVRSLQPPIVDDVRAFRFRRVISSLRLRTKVTILVNRELERLAANAGARYLDMWPQFSRGGILDASLFLDGDHMNRRSSELTLAALLRDLVDRRGAPVTGDQRFDFSHPHER